MVQVLRLRERSLCQMVGEYLVAHPVMEDLDRAAALEAVATRRSESDRYHGAFKLADAVALHVKYGYFGMFCAYSLGER
jgi:hypothetical protein